MESAKSAFKFIPNYALEKIKKEKTFTTENTERHGKTTKIFLIPSVPCFPW